MFPNLIGQAKVRGMNNESMAEMIGVTRQTYEKKLKSGNFNVNEINTLLNFFKKPYDYLFSEE